ncbi:MAG: hypothetical protein ACFFAT_17875 [Promethearchaeota archaeon]
MAEDKMGQDIDSENIDLIINDLKNSFDNLEHGNLDQTQGFQLKLAKTIASLRQLKVSKIEDNTLISNREDDETSKNFLLNQLDYFLYLLEQLDGSGAETQRKKFDLIMKIAKLREKIREF